MTDVVTITGTVFLLIGLGYVSVRQGMFSQRDLRVFGKYVVNFALPALIFSAVASRDIGEVFNLGYIGAYLTGAVSVLFLGYFWSRHVARQTRLESTFQAMGMSCPNSGFVGYPILLMAMPSLASTALALNMVVENLVLIPLILILAERATGSAKGWALVREIARRLAFNPIILALVCGLVVSLLGLKLPDILAKPVSLISSSSAAISLLVIGGTLVGLPIKAIDGRIAMVVFGKLILLPACVWAGTRIMQAIGYGIGSDQLEMAAILVAATPAMGIYPILAQRYGQEDNAALAMLVMTVMSFFTISAMLFLI